MWERPGAMCSYLSLLGIHGISSWNVWVVFNWFLFGRLLVRGACVGFICDTGSSGRTTFPVAPESDTPCVAIMWRMVVILLDTCWG